MSYNEEIERKFYASYVATLRGSLDRQLIPAKHDPLTMVIVRGCRVDISPTTILLFLYIVPTDPTWDPLTPEFNYRWGLVKSG